MASKRQPKDPFNGAADWEPKVKKPRAKKDSPDVKAMRLVLYDIRTAAQASLARLETLGELTVRQDLLWIIDLTRVA